jgi:hypothetical protein
MTQKNYKPLTNNVKTNKKFGNTLRGCLNCIQVYQVCSVYIGTVVHPVI